MKAVDPAPTHLLVDRDELASFDVDGGTITAGNRVEVMNPSGTKADYKANVLAIHRFPDGRVEVDVFGGKNGHELTRTVLPERLRWTKQPPPKKED